MKIILLTQSCKESKDVWAILTEISERTYYSFLSATCTMAIYLVLLDILNILLINIYLTIDIEKANRIICICVNGE